jgi:hypothetical protein
MQVPTYVYVVGVEDGRMTSWGERLGWQQVLARRDKGSASATGGLNVAFTICIIPIWLLTGVDI